MSELKDFIYSIPTTVYFGKDQTGNIGSEVASHGKKVLIVYGGGSVKKIGLFDKVVAELDKAGIAYVEFGGVEPNPRIDTVRRAVEVCKKEGIDVIMPIGGGSTIDAAKLIAAGAKVDFDPWLFVSEYRPISEALPIVVVLTVAATGSEMDAIGVISNPETQDKLAFASPAVRPKAAFLDPTNTFTVSKFQTASGAADIFSHVCEDYFNMEPGLYMLDCFMEGLMKTVIKYGPIALAEPDNYEARANLMWAASWAINGFTKGGNNNTWCCHAIEHELSAIYDVTHGLGLAIVTPRWMEYSLTEENASKFASFGVNVFGIDASLPEMEIAKKAIEATSDFFFNKLGLQSHLKDIGIDETNLRVMAEKSCRYGGLPGIKLLLADDVEQILKNCL